MRLHLAVGRCAETNNDMAVLQLTRDWAGDAVRPDTRNSQSMACTNALGALLPNRSAMAALLPRLDLGDSC